MNITGYYSAPASIGISNVQTLTDKNKGSMGNRIDCAKDQTINTLKTTGKSIATAAAIGAGSGLALKSKSANNLVNKGIEAAKKFVSNNDTLKDLAPKLKTAAANLATKFKNMPASGKVIVGATAALALVNGIILEKTHSFKAGQIDQKYNDKAQLQNTLEQKNA